MKTLLEKFLVLGHHPGDSEDEKLRKTSLVIMSGPFAFAGLLWGLLYWANGLVISGYIPFVYGLLSIASVIYFAKTHRYTFFRNSQLLLILILPFSLQISLGGFIPASAVILWAIISPAGALVFHSTKRALMWFAAFLTLVIIAFIINGYLPNYISWDISNNFINALFLLNIVGVSSIVFGIQYYFVAKQKELKEAIQAQNLELEEQSNKLKEMDEIKSRFFANISHEFRTPLTLILGLVDKQLENPNEPAKEKDSQTIKRNADRLLQLINQLLDLSKLESGEVKLAASKSDIVQYTKVITSQFESFAHSKNLTLTFNGDDVAALKTYPEISLYFDNEKLQKVITNLLSNAMKFTPEGGKVTVNIGSAENEKVSIKVANTGEPIPEEKLPYLFDRFYQVDAESNREYEGTGIGLALVKELVELHHGNVTAESNEHFTAFTVELPITNVNLKESEKVEAQPIDVESETQIPPIQPTTVSTDSEQEDLEATDSGLLEVMVVEDNPDLRAFIRDIIETDYHVIEAVDGIDGMEKGEAHIPDLIISDVMMPRMDGYEMCKQLKSNPKTDHIPIILLTAKASKDDKLEGLEIGADDYLTKPFDKDELKARIKNLISNREKLQKRYQQELSLKPKTVKVTSAGQKFIDDLKLVIEANISNENFSVEDLARSLVMSRSQVHRKLKALTDQSVTRFIKNYRLHRAADLLKQEAGNVTEIAYQVGFSSQTYFSSSFQELFGCAPSEYKGEE